MCKYADEHTIVYATRRIIEMWPNPMYWRVWLVQEIAKIDVEGNSAYIASLERPEDLTPCCCINRECYQEQLDAVCRLAKWKHTGQKKSYDAPPYIIIGAIKVFIDRNRDDTKDWRKWFIDQIYDMNIPLERGLPTLRLQLEANQEKKALAAKAKAILPPTYKQANEPKPSGLALIWRKLLRREKHEQHLKADVDTPDAVSGAPEKLVAEPAMRGIDVLDVGPPTKHQHWLSDSTTSKRSIRFMQQRGLR